MQYKDINLLPNSYLKIKKNTILTIILIVSQLFIVIFLILAWQVVNHVLYVNSSRLYYVSSPNPAEANEIANEVYLLQQGILQKNSLLDALGQTVNNEHHIDIVLQGLPSSLKHEYISYSNGRILISVLTENKNYIPIFTDNMNSIGYFRGVQISSAANVEGGTLFIIEMFLE